MKYNEIKLGKYLLQDLLDIQKEIKQEAEKIVAEYRDAAMESFKKMREATEKEDIDKYLAETYEYMKIMLHTSAVADVQFYIDWDRGSSYSNKYSVVSFLDTTENEHMSYKEAKIDRKGNTYEVKRLKHLAQTLYNLAEEAEHKSERWHNSNCY